MLPAAQDVHLALLDIPSSSTGRHTSHTCFFSFPHMMDLSLPSNMSGALLPIDNIPAARANTQAPCLTFASLYLGTSR